MIKNILFDLGGVLYKVDYRETAQKLADIFSATMEFSQKKNYRLLQNMKRGTFPRMYFAKKYHRLFIMKGMWRIHSSTMHGM
jgi:FMN phosphatase YigB (HAD superfamily)